MKANVGTIDRALRTIVGLILVILAFTTITGTTATWVAVIVGAVLIGTASIRFCPAYRILGIQTCKS